MQKKNKKTLETMGLCRLSDSGFLQDEPRVGEKIITLGGEVDTEVNFPMTRSLFLLCLIV